MKDSVVLWAFSSSDHDLHLSIFPLEMQIASDACFGIVLFICILRWWALGEKYSAINVTVASWIICLQEHDYES
jgi:hypothetical protein